MIFPGGWNETDAGIKDTRFHWKGYPGRSDVPYVLDASVQKYEQLIRQGMEQYHKFTCIRFVPRTNEKDYIRIFEGNGCWSMIGRMGGRQDLFLGEGCGYVGLVVHELGHAIGLFHEHQRSGRGSYIRVYPENVERGYLQNFERIDSNKELIFTRYDYNSIMHYGNYAFSKQPNTLMTMEAKWSKTRFKEPYDKPGLVYTDIITIRRLYKC